MQALRCEHEDEIQNLHLQNSREDRQRVLLQLQRKGMSDKPKEDQEANLKQVNSHEYEVETYNGRTIKRRRVMFEDPRKHKRYTPEANATASVKVRPFHVGISD
ncbi:hypothetical protein L6164_030586 [Bauhinia variegata]|uniref:Uncharacterized protein n=1 Tax=Bauhinia variegata TaxID=167791 RepID=A0ACB9LD52_BAUVA|nr:hypothetical protein L6164_030586 [Bauhinia variegata]